MSVNTTVIIEGFVSRVSVREIPARAAAPGVAAREAMQFTNVLVVGDYTLADCTLGRDVSVPPQGTFITAEATVSTFRDDDQITIQRYIERQKEGK